MRRMLVIAVFALLTGPALAQVMDDFDCVSDLNGPETPAGTMRVSSDAEFAWLDAQTAMPGPFQPFTLDGERVGFSRAFAEHISPGATLIEASYFAASATFEAVLHTADGRVVLVSCPYIP